MHSPSSRIPLYHNQNCHVLNVRGGEAKNRTTASTSPKKNQSSQELKCENGVCKYVPTKEIRGGAFIHTQLDDYYDEYDSSRYDEESDEEPVPRPARRTTNRPATRPRHPQPSPQRDHRRRPPPNRYAGPPSNRGRRSRSKAGVLGNAASLAKKSVDMTTSAAAVSGKAAGKAAFYLVSPKHVTRKEVWGVWRLDQQVGTSADGPMEACAANVELTHRGDCITKYKDEVYRTPYTFVEKSWPRSCSVEFEARAYQGPNDDQPVTMLYKGYFRRKIADKRVVKIVGKIYQVRRGMLGRKGKRELVGTFVARRRITAPPREEEDFDDDYDDEYDDEYDDYDEYDLEDSEF